MYRNITLNGNRFGPKCRWNADGRFWTKIFNKLGFGGSVQIEAIVIVSLSEGDSGRF